ncbi:MAG: TonB-dependent receptor [bacterium]
MKDKLLDIFRSILTIFLLYLISLLCSISYAQEETSEEEKAIDLPPVKIEILDATQLTIPKEKFEGFRMISPDIYVTLNPKERLWYLPPTSIPDKPKQKSSVPTEDFLFSVSAYPGIPAALTYQMLLIKGFGDSQALIDMGRSMLQSARSAKLASDPSKKQGNTTIDDFKGSFSYQRNKTSARIDLNYNAKDLAYLDSSGAKYLNDRYLIGLSTNWSQKYLDDIQSNLQFNISQLRMEGPYSDESNSGFDMKTRFDMMTYLPPRNPIDIGSDFEYFRGDGVDEMFKEAIFKLYIRDNFISIAPFVLGAGIELALNMFTSSFDENWKINIYPNPYLLLTSQFGSNFTFQLGLERYLNKSSLKEIYIVNEYVNFNPSLATQKEWNIHSSLKYALTRKISTTLGIFDKQISDITTFEEKNNKEGIIYWVPVSRKSARIFGIGASMEASLLNGKFNNKVEYIHEFHDQEDRIFYRPKDKGSIITGFTIGSSVNMSLTAEFNGPRYINAEGDKLSSYFMLKPKISRSFGKNAIASLQLGLYFSDNELQLWREYKIPNRTLDFGLTLRF